MKKRKSHVVGVVYCIDLMLTGIALCVFALFHHVLPRKGTSENYTIAESKTQTTWRDTFSSKFSDGVIMTEDGYSSPNVSIQIETHTMGNDKSSTTYYVADVYVADITCFQTCFADDSYGSGYRDTIGNMAVINQALLAINGDYYGNSDEGVVIRNGVVYRSEKTSADVCVLYRDGTMKVYDGESFDIQEAIDNQAYQAWTFGPMLLDEQGGVCTTFASSKRIQSKNPRSAIGYYEPGHYCFVTVDGRNEGGSSGMTLEEMSKLFHELGCVSAYNLDGGKSSVMIFEGEVVNQPYDGGRESSDCLVIKEVAE